MTLDISDFEAGLRAMDDALSEQAMVNALKLGAGVFQRSWKRKVPYRSGTYRRSIQVKILERGSQRVIVAIGTNIVDPPYPLFLEYGTRKMKARPSARPAWDESKAGVSDEVRKSLKLMIDQATRRRG
jgi:HK97 gp10 family phage protein